MIGRKYTINILTKNLFIRVDRFNCIFSDKHRSSLMRSSTWPSRWYLCQSRQIVRSTLQTSNCKVYLKVWQCHNFLSTFNSLVSSQNLRPSGCLGANSDLCIYVSTSLLYYRKLISGNDIIYGGREFHIFL